MLTLTVPFYALFTDHSGNPFDFTRATVILANSVGWLRVVNEEATPFSRHSFIVEDATVLGLGGDSQLSREDAVQLLATCCSLANRRVLFTTRSFAEHYGEVGYPPEPATPVGEAVNADGRIVRTYTRTVRVSAALSTLTEEVVEVDEAVVRVLTAAIMTKVVSRLRQSVWCDNMAEALRVYGEARNAFDPEPRYQLLHIALEKALYANGQDEKGTAFAQSVDAATGMGADRFEELLAFNNRVKHILRNGKYLEDRAVLEQARAQMANWLLDMKQASDAVIMTNLAAT